MDRDGMEVHAQGAGDWGGEGLPCRRECTASPPFSARSFAADTTSPSLRRSRFFRRSTTSSVSSPPRSCSPVNTPSPSPRLESSLRLLGAIPPSSSVPFSSPTEVGTSYVNFPSPRLDQTDTLPQLGSIGGGRYSDRVLRRLTLKNNGQGEPEMRIKSVSIPLYILPPFFIVYAWLVQYSISIYAIVITLFILGGATIWIYSSTLACRSPPPPILDRY